MHIANDTEDEVLYTVGDPGDPILLSQKSFCVDPSSAEGIVVRFFRGKEQVAVSQPVEDSAVLICLRKRLFEYEVAVLREQA